jgi:hypothetical protein
VFPSPSHPRSAACVNEKDHADYIDLNLGCPQRIAKRGYYGAFLMESLPLVQQMVAAAARHLKIPVSVKIRLFPELQTTIDYALMLQQAGASLLAIHGRTRDMKVCAGGGGCKRILSLLNSTLLNVIGHIMGAQGSRRCARGKVVCARGYFHRSVVRPASSLAKHGCTRARRCARGGGECARGYFHGSMVCSAKLTGQGCTRDRKVCKGGGPMSFEGVHGGGDVTS